MNAYQTQLKELLVKSTITTGFYTPSEFVKNATHIAVLLDGKPVYLAGEADCEVSTNEAKLIADNDMYKLGLSKIGLTGELSYGVVSGSDIEWNDSHNAIVESESGVFEDGQGVGKLIGINLTENQPLGQIADEPHFLKWGSLFRAAVGRDRDIFEVYLRLVESTSTHPSLVHASAETLEAVFQLIDTQQNHDR